MKVTPNWVLIEFDDSNQYLKIGDTKITIDTTYEPERRAQVQGKVLDFGGLFFSTKSINSVEYDVPLEIQKGDTVMFHFLCVANAIQNGRYSVIDGKKVIYVWYDQLFCSIRNGELIPLNGWIFVEPNVETIQSDTIFIPNPKQVSQRRGVVKYIGQRVARYKSYPNQSDFDCDVNIGDEIIFSESDAIKLHDSLGDVPLKGFYRLHRIDILGILNAA